MTNKVIPLTTPDELKTSKRMRCARGESVRRGSSRPLGD
jgi:hypothetical protein